MTITLVSMRKLLKEELTPINNELEEVKKTTEKLDEMMKIEKRVDIIEKNQARILQDNNKCNQLCQSLSEQMLSLDARSRKHQLKLFKYEK